MLAVVNTTVVLGTIFGTVLHSVLSLLIRRRIRKRAGERVFMRLVLVGVAYNFGLAASVFLELLLKRRAIHICAGLESVSLVAMGLMPSLLLHNFLTFYRPRWLRGLWPVILYLPSLTMVPSLSTVLSNPQKILLDNLSSPIVPFLLWAITAVLASSAIAFAMYREEPTGRSSGANRTIGLLLLYISIVLATVSIAAPYDIPFLSDFLKVAAILSPNLLAFVFAYSVYRYNYLGYFMKASLFHTMLASFALSLYFFGIRWIGELLETQYDIDFRVLEAGLVLALLFAFAPIKDSVEKLAYSLFFKNVGQARDQLKDLSNELNAVVLPSLHNSMYRVCRTLRDLFSTDAARVILLTPQYEEYPKEASPFPSFPETLKEWLLKNPVGVTGVEEVSDPTIAATMENHRISWIIPLARDNQVIGAIVIGHRDVDSDLTPDEKDMLTLLANQITMVVEKHHILDQMIGLERRLLETDKLSSLGRLAASVAHEIKNPLSSIKAIIQAAREDEQVQPPLSDDLAVVVEEIDRLNATVNRLLNYIRPEMTPNKVVGVEGIIEGVLDILRHESEKRGVAVSTDPSKESHYIRGHTEDLKSILFNIVLNGLEAMPKGGHLRISSRSLRKEIDDESTLNSSRERARKWVQIEIRDTGCGILEGEIERLFEPFQTSKEGGTGLGLAIVKQKVEELSGTIRVESSPEGTVFFLELPVLGRV